MVAGCGGDVKVWRFDKGIQVEEKRLLGTKSWVYSLVFSKKVNWFAQGDKILNSWRQKLNTDWEEGYQQYKHKDSIVCLILNNTEDELISCSYDKTIIVWKSNCDKNDLFYNYTLENKHTDSVLCISLNESETVLASCSKDRQIILWNKGENQQWKYMNHITCEDFGYRICFIGDNYIAWQQASLGHTHIFYTQDEKIWKRRELQFTNHNRDCYLFPTIYNKKTQVLIQKHGRYVYVIKNQENWTAEIEAEQIDQEIIYSYGQLTQDGEYLVIWNDKTREFQVYKILLG